MTAPFKYRGSHSLEIILIFRQRNQVLEAFLPSISLTAVKSAEQENNFLISQPKHMLRVLKSRKDV